MLPRLVITDIDGVWTDGGMYYTSEGDIMKKFSVKDGWGVAFLNHLGIPVAIMTGEKNEVVTRRANKLKVDYCFLGVKDKLTKAKELCGELGISLAEVAFIGDDLNDALLLKAVGISGCPSGTPEYVASIVDFRGRVPGGAGAFREFVESILGSNGVLNEVLGHFLK